jgi:hypothetical protein
MEGKTIADGDLTETAKGENVTTHLMFHFKDGSIHDETALYSQTQEFRLLQYHLIQNGPSFKRRQETWIDAVKGKARVQYTDKDGSDRLAEEKLNLPPDLANGITLTLLKNIRPETPKTTVTMVATTPKPRLVSLIITPGGQETFSLVGSSRKAIRYDVSVEIGGVAGWLAHLTGKAPPITHVWILEGDAPAFVKSEGPFCAECPIWRIELASPVWPAVTAEHRESTSK